MAFLDGRLLPIERPEGRTYLQERLEGRQVAWLHYLMTPGDEWGIGLELTSGARMVIWAMLDRGFAAGQSPYRLRLMLRWIPPQRVWSGRMRRYFGRGRDTGLGTAVTPPVGPDLGAELPDDVQRRVEGEVIVGASPTYDPNPDGGERILIEFRGGGRLRLDALAPRAGGRRCRADMDVAWLPPPEVSRVWVPGMQA